MGVKKTNHGALQTTQGMDSTKPKGGLISENYTYVTNHYPENIFGRLIVLKEVIWHLFLVKVKNFLRLRHL